MGLRIGTIVVVLGLTLGLTAQAVAQRRPGAGRVPPVHKQEAARQQARQARMDAEFKAMQAKERRDEAFAERQAVLQAEIDGLKQTAAAENRPLNAGEEEQIALVTRRMEQMKATREAVIAARQEAVAEAKEDAARDRERVRTIREDQCRLAGAHRNRIDRPRSGAGC